MYNDNKVQKLLRISRLQKPKQSNIEPQYICEKVGYALKEARQITEGRSGIFVEEPYRPRPWKKENVSKTLWTLSKRSFRKSSFLEVPFRKNNKFSKGNKIKLKIVLSSYLLLMSCTAFASSHIEIRKYEDFFTADIYDQCSIFGNPRAVPPVPALTIAECRQKLRVLPQVLPTLSEMLDDNEKLQIFCSIREKMDRPDPDAPAGAAVRRLLLNPVAFVATLSDVEVQALIILAGLYDNKILSIRNKVAKDYLDKIAMMASTISDSGMKQRLLSGAKGIISGLAAGVGSFLDCRKGSTVAMMMMVSKPLALGSAVAGGVAVAVGGILDAVSDPSQIDPKKLEEDRKALLDEIDFLKKGVNREAIFPQEKVYVLHKRSFPKPLQDSVEDVLILARKGGFFLPTVISLMHNVSKLPIEPRKLLPQDPHQRDAALAHKLTAFSQDPFFSNFSIVTKRKLAHMISELSLISMMPSEMAASVPLKRFYYFWGNAGIGKSQAAKRFAQLINLPSFEAYLRVEGDLSRENLEGSELYGMGTPKAGWIVRPLLETSEEMERGVSNALLIINDFDRLFLAAGERADSAYAFLLDYLDPLKKDFFSPYFTSPIDISRLSIIITGNSPIPETPFYAALRSRLKIIEFLNFPPEKVTKILGEYLETITEKYGEEPFLPEMKRVLVETADRSVATPSMRDKKMAIDNILVQRRAAKVGRLLRGMGQPEVASYTLKEDPEIGGLGEKSIQLGHECEQRHEWCQSVLFYLNAYEMGCEYAKNDIIRIGRSANGEAGAPPVGSQLFQQYVGLSFTGDGAPPRPQWDLQH